MNDDEIRQTAQRLGFWGTDAWWLQNMPRFRALCGKVNKEQVAEDKRWTHIREKHGDVINRSVHICCYCAEDKIAEQAAENERLKSERDHAHKSIQGLIEGAAKDAAEIERLKADLLKTSGDHIKHFEDVLAERDRLIEYLNDIQLKHFAEWRDRQR